MEALTTIADTIYFLLNPNAWIKPDMSKVKALAGMIVPEFEGGDSDPKRKSAECDNFHHDADNLPYA